MLPRSLARFGLLVQAPPAPHDALHVDRRARASDREQARLRLRGRDTRQGADLRVGELPTRHRVGQCRQRPEGTRHPHVLSGGAGSKSYTPGEPLGAGAETVGPTLAYIELPDQSKQAGGCRLEVSGELGNLVTQTIQLREMRGVGLRRLQRAGKIRWKWEHGESPF